MQIITKKITLIYFPFLVISISFIVLYTFSNWLLIINTNTFSFREDIVRYWLPFGLPWIPVLIWLRPRIKLLKLYDKQPMLYYFIAALAMGIPSFIAQGYIEKAAGTLTKLETINEIETSKPTKYYTLKHYYIDKRNAGVYSFYNVSGKSGGNMNMHIYYVLPIFSSEADTANSGCLAWIGVEYCENVTDRPKEKDKEESFKAFADESAMDFAQKDVSQFVYLDRVGNSYNSDGFKEALKSNPKYNPNHTSVFLAVNEPLENRNGNTFAWIFRAFEIAGGIWFLMLLIPKFDENKLNQFESGEDQIS